jgi:hypothetical protein
LAAEEVGRKLEQKVLADLGNIKGVAFGEFLSWYGVRFGSQRLLSATRDLHGKYPDVFDLGRATHGILPSRWYPALLVHEVVDRLTAEFSPKELDSMALDAADVIMNKTLRGVYRAIFALIATPERYVKHIDRLWSLHYDSGRPVVLVMNPTTHRVHYEGWRSHHPFICRLNMAAARAIYIAMGCRDVRLERLGCVSDGARYCENVVRCRG